jgi:ABC-type branched-subunit amino acid transport system ATPase component/predicted MFS family arabinose efflux permease
MTIAPERSGSAAALASALMDEEARRQAEAQATTAPTLISDDRLVGVGEDALSLKQVLRVGGTSTLAILFALNFVDEFENIIVTVLGPEIQRSLHLSDMMLALVRGLPGILVVFAALPLGLLADRRSRTRLVAVTSVLWSVAMLASGLVLSTWQFVLTRVGVGVGKGNFPITTAVLTDQYPVGGRTRVLGANNLANPLAGLLGPLLAGGIAHYFGWRATFVVLALPCLLFAVVAFSLKEPARGSNERAALVGDNGLDAPTVESDPIPFAAAFTRLRQVRSFAALMSALGAIGLGVAGVPTVFYLLLERDYHLGAFGRGTVATFVSLGGIVGIALASRKADALFREDPSKVLRLVAGSMALFSVLFPLSVVMPNVALLIVLQAAAAAVLAGPFAVTSAIVAAVVPYRMRSFAFSIVGINLVLVGGLFGGAVTGALSDGYGPRVAIGVIVPVSFLLAATYMLSASRFVKRDMATVVEELEEEQRESLRVADGSSSDELLQIRNLDFSYGPVQVLFDVDLVVRRGEVLALLGTNGAGKSTVLRAISGLALPERGVIRFGGRAVTFTDATERVRRGIVQVPGGKAVFPSLTVRENLLAGMHTFIWDDARVEKKSREVLALFPRLHERLDQPAGTLSGGEQQMLALAKALLLDPELLLIDELSLGLAPVMVQEILQTIDVLKERGITMVIVEQSLNVALSISDRAVFMEKGRVRFEGPAAELMQRDDLARAVFLGGEGG